MGENDWLAERFEENRAHLHRVAYRMLGSLSEADDAVQEAWLRLTRAGADGIDNLGGWLTTVVARVCLDMLRSRKSRREVPLEPVISASRTVADPEQEAQLADSVGLALLVVLETLAPAERLAFVLHDMFAVPFDEIAPIVGRTPTAARQLASRARRRVQGMGVARAPELARKREIVEAFLAAARGGDFNALMALLDPDVVLRADAVASYAGKPMELRGAKLAATRAAKGGARAARPALVDGDVGVVVAPKGKLLMVLRYTIKEGKIVGMEAIGDPERLRQFDLAILEG